MKWTMQGKNVEVVHGITHLGITLESTGRWKKT
jgi:hypothetical protein